LADHVGWCEAKRLGKRENGRKEHVAKEPPRQMTHHRQGPKGGLYQMATSLAWQERRVNSSAWFGILDSSVPITAKSSRPRIRVIGDPGGLINCA
jgi:hypothetical protein